MIIKILTNPMLWLIIGSSSVFFYTKSILLSAVVGTAVILLCGLLKSIKYVAVLFIIMACLICYSRYAVH